MTYKARTEPTMRTTRQFRRKPTLIESMYHSLESEEEKLKFYLMMGLTEVPRGVEILPNLATRGLQRK